MKKGLGRMRACWSAVLTGVLACLMLAWPGAAQVADAYEADFAALTQHPHRLAGSAYGREAGAYLETRLRSMGVDEVLVQDFPVWGVSVEQCELRVGELVLDLEPMRANQLALPVTGLEGIDGPVMYVGRGEPADYGDRDAQGAIVLLDYDCGDNWETAFALGAAAVVMVGDGSAEQTPIEARHVAMPANLVRLYLDASAHPDALQRLGVTDGEAVQGRVVSVANWTLRQGRNVVGVIRGEGPAWDEGRGQEALVLSARYDSFGTVPGLSGGARSAANVAAVLQAAEGFVAQPARRDVVVLFVDNQAQFHQGAREFYEAVFMTDETDARLRDQQAAELELTRGMLANFRERGGVRFAQAMTERPDGADKDVVDDLFNLMRELANDASDDLEQLKARLRLRRYQAELERGQQAVAADPVYADYDETIESLEAQNLRWDNVLRALFFNDWSARGYTFELYAAEVLGGEDAAGYAQTFAALEAHVLERLTARESELLWLTGMDQQRASLRSALRTEDGPIWIALHIDMDLADLGFRWGGVVQDATYAEGVWGAELSPQGDGPGLHDRVLATVGELYQQMGGATGTLGRLDEATLTEVTIARTFAAGLFVQAGAIAGDRGIYHMGLMTGGDARPRDGHPADTPANLNLANLRAQANEAVLLVDALADAEGISQGRSFSPVAESRYPQWKPGRTSGDRVGLQISGLLSEQRPASGAVFTMWPRQNGETGMNTWNSAIGMHRAPHDYEPMLFEPVQQNGHLRLVGVNKDLFAYLTALGATFDPHGQITAISSSESVSTGWSVTYSVKLFPANGYVLVMPRRVRTGADLLKILRSVSDAGYRPNLHLAGQVRDFAFFWLSVKTVDNRVKLYQPMGVAAFGEGIQQGLGRGIALDTLASPLALSSLTARDLWGLNELRLSTLRARGVTSADLELMHSRAERLLEQSEAADSVASRRALAEQSAALSHRVAPSVRSLMDDLVYAVVALLLLTIPFAFALERLLIGSTTVYGRIGGFTLVFMITFGLLYAMHPGFAIASTPIIIFLAFSIILLSAMVIYIVIRKFNVELRALQGQGSSAGAAEASRAGTMLAAVGMGMSTMRRRPTRTTLTALTVVMLTFTILCFASFSRTIGVREVYLGPASPTTEPTLLVRELDFGQISEANYDTLATFAGEDGYLAKQVWLQRPNPDVYLTVVRQDDGRQRRVEALMGLEAEELRRWPALAATLGEGEVEAVVSALEQGGVFLPPLVAEELGAEVGDAVLVQGRLATFAGVIDSSAMNRLRNLDGQSVVPADALDLASLLAQEQSGVGVASANDTFMVADIQKDTVHLSADQIVVMSAAGVEERGGAVHLMNLYLSAEVDGMEVGRRVAALVVMPIWAEGTQGVSRLVMTQLTEVSGGLALAVPLLLGGLIVFGTLLGSINDREKEIYTFSALGLSPVHVGVLFLAESAVYAVVGGVGGQLLGQFVALAAGWLSSAGVIPPTSINFSSTNSMFAIAVVMATVLVSALYPAVKASKSANPGLARAWKMPPAEGDELRLTFPFTVSAYDITGMVSYLAEHFRRHDDAGLGAFAASDVAMGRTEDGELYVATDLALAPFDLGVTERLTLKAVDSEIEGVQEIGVVAERKSGANGDWIRSNRNFLKDLRKQFLLWRTLSAERIEMYRHETLTTLGEASETEDPHQKVEA